MNNEVAVTDIFPLGGHRGMGCTDHEFYAEKRDRGILPVENTADSIAAAYQSGAAYVELDGCVTRDRVAIVIHNVKVEDHFFTAQKPPAPLNQVDFDAIRECPTGRSGKGKLARLTDVLNICAANDPGVLPYAVNVEIKGVQGAGQGYDGDVLVPLLAQAALESGLDARRILWSSFALENVLRMAGALPQSQYGMLFAEPGTERPIYADHGDSFAHRYLQFTPANIAAASSAMRNHASETRLSYLHPEITSVTPATLDQAAAHGCGVNVWALFEAPPDPARLALYRDTARLATQKGVAFTAITDYLPQMLAL